MARAYICLARRDIEDSGLQILDLQPNSSQRVPAYDGAGQTAYLPFSAQSDTIVTAGDDDTTAAAYNGVAAYLMDNVENVGGGATAVPLTDAQAIAITLLLRGIVRAGTALTLATINTAINTPAGVSDSDLNGVVADSRSTGTVAEMLQIMQGQVYTVPASSAMSDDGAWIAPADVHTRLGSFIARTATGFRDIKVFTDTGALQISCGSGHLFALSRATFSWHNPSLTYGAGTALFVDGTAIPATFLGRAVTVYDASGNLLA
jgi:hypothetical protein